ncbi:FemAB family XrtA/PEP-CTERM system-associated protein [Arenibaculum pallidiluteum]|uniref:FemAB family XrtA/PEP-CTERM system-associated protein n=1 Tax=Arenibaculum pallidiluteum TaxID=2812559 RepID=UPI001A959790|nr:FemAB family XrtA/PEP-CTERM system-associated protein [Arenibaculum pallidiluteum]
MTVALSIPTVRPAAAADEASWESFVARCPEATFFHRWGWRRAIETAHGHRTHYLMAERNGETVGILPLVQLRSPLFGHALVSTGFTVGGGIAALDAAAEAALATAAAELGARLGAAHVELRHRRPLGIGWIDKSDLYCGFRRAIPEGGDDAILKAIPRKKRADIRKSLGTNLVTELGDLDRFYALYAESVRNLGTPVPARAWFRALRDAFGEDCEIAVVRGEAGDLSAVMSFHFRDEALPYYAGSVPAARPVHAYDYLYFDLMRRAAARGARIFDFGRSKRGTGPFDYKTYWGFEPEPLHYQFHLLRGGTLPEVNPLNPKYRLMVEGWRRLPLPVANLLGPHLARQLG